MHIIVIKHVKHRFLLLFNQDAQAVTMLIEILGNVLNFVRMVHLQMIIQSIARRNVIILTMLIQY